MNKDQNNAADLETQNNKFNHWIEKLQESKKSYEKSLLCPPESSSNVITSDSNTDNNLTVVGTVDNSIKLINETIKLEESKYPSWIESTKDITAANAASDKLNKMVSSSKDTKIFLRHIAFPNVIDSYQSFIDELSVKQSATNSTVLTSVEENLKNNSSKLNSNKPIPFHTAPLSSENDSNSIYLNEYMNGMQNGRADGIIDICKLADISHRINRASDHDSEQISNWLQNEKVRKVKNEASLSDRQHRLNLLAGTDEESTIDTCFDLLNTECVNLNWKFTVALSEEDEARKALEAAILKRKNAFSEVENIESYIGSAMAQRDLLKKINMLRVEVEDYNQSSANARIKVFNEMNDYINNIKSEFVSKRLVKELPLLLDNLIKIFNISTVQPIKSSFIKTENADNKYETCDNIPLQCAIRCGIETIRIWKQLNSESIYSELNDKIVSFEKELKSLLENLVQDEHINKKQFSYDDNNKINNLSGQTVVLYFDHIHHETPLEHVEGQSRVQTCLKLLFARLSSNGLENEFIDSNNDLDSNEFSENLSHKRAAQRQRSLKMVNCNDIISPPLWCLPLTHSPQYLSHLWKLAKEANTGDFFVPLEFDTEWESEDPYKCSSDDEDMSFLRGRTAANSTKLKKNIEVNEELIEVLGSNKEIFTSTLTPSDGDFLVAKVVKQLELQSNRFSKLKQNGNDAESKSKSNNNDDTSHRFEVKTPYGNGYVVNPDYGDDLNAMVEVNLVWGAIGYFRSNVVELVNPLQAKLGNSNGSNYSNQNSKSLKNGSNVPNNDKRFMHTDLKLHWLLHRLISRIKVQRNISEWAGLNHASLSLWMHGRTSPGLNRTLEGGIKNWLSKYDRSNLDRLLDETENDDFTAPNYASEFMKKLQSLKIDPTSLNGNEHDDMMEVDNDNDEELVINGPVERANAVRYATEKIQKRNMSHGSNNTSVGWNPSKNRSSLKENESYTERIENNKSIEVNTNQLVDNSNSKLLDSTEGEVLRQLMNTVMSNTKISQSGLANEYYKYFREETSQGGVSSWFHYRGKPLVLERMTRCALMWLEDNQSTLSESERKSFERVSLAMNHKLHGKTNHENHNISSSINNKQNFNNSIDLDDNVSIVSDNPIAMANTKKNSKPLKNKELKVSSPRAQNEDEITSKPTAIEDNTIFESITKPSLIDNNVLVLDLPKVITIKDLHSAVIFELKRRKISQSKAAIEADLKNANLGQTAVSRFLSIATVTNNERGATFCKHMLRWLQKSVLLESAPESSSSSDVENESKLDDNDDSVNNSSGESEDEYVSNQPEEVVKNNKKSNNSKNDTKTPSSPPSKKQVNIKKDKVEKEISDDKCGLCGKEAATFNTIKAFHMHIAWCYRRKNGMEPPPEYSLGRHKHRVNNKPISKNDEVDTDNNDMTHKKRKSDQIVSDDIDKKRSKLSVTSSDNNNNNNKKKARTPISFDAGNIYYDNDLLVDPNIFEADTYDPNDHYDTCEVCKDDGNIILCDGCPCVYHMKCAELDNDKIPTGKWYCVRCVEMGVSSATVLPYETKISKNIENKWILVWVSSLHRWKKALVITTWSFYKGCVLIKWWRRDRRSSGKVNWLDISKAKVLLAQPEPINSSFVKIRFEQKAPNSTTSGNKSNHGVKFEDQFDHNKRDGNKNFEQERLRLGNPSMSAGMDGESNGRMTNAAYAAAAGIGGISALFGDDNLENSLKLGGSTIIGNGMSDTYISSNSLKAALCTSGTACRAVDIVMVKENINTNVFVCARPPGHHAGRYGCTSGCLSTGFCLLNNAAIAAIYSRVRWGLLRVAVVDIDVHFGNGTAELLKNDSGAFFASVHMIYGENNNGDIEGQNSKSKSKEGFYPSLMGQTVIDDNYVSVGVYPSVDRKLRGKGSGNYSTVAMSGVSKSSVGVIGMSLNDEENNDGVNGSDNRMDVIGNNDDENGEIHNKKNAILAGADGYHTALNDIIIPQMEKFKPQLLIISAGFDGYKSDPLGGKLCLSLDDYSISTKM
eukprot:gene10232-13764_t